MQIGNRFFEKLDPTYTITTAKTFNHIKTKACLVSYLTVGGTVYNDLTSQFVVPK